MKRLSILAVTIAAFAIGSAYAQSSPNRAYDYGSKYPQGSGSAATDKTYPQGSGSSASSSQYPQTGTAQAQNGQKKKQPQQQ